MRRGEPEFLTKQAMKVRDNYVIKQSEVQLRHCCGKFFVFVYIASEACATLFIMLLLYNKKLNFYAREEAQ